MDGADALMRTLVNGGHDLVHQPGNDRAAPGGGSGGDSGLRSVLGLFEGVVSGAADGYGRIAGRPAATLVIWAPVRAMPGPTFTTPAVRARRSSA